MRRDGSDASRESTADGILQHLAEIGAGRCRITDDDLAAAPSDVSRERLVGLLTLYEILKYSVNCAPSRSNTAIAWSRTFGPR